jgi:hypothetical protein
LCRACPFTPPPYKNTLHAISNITYTAPPPHNLPHDPHPPHPRP